MPGISRSWYTSDAKAVGTRSGGAYFAEYGRWLRYVRHVGEASEVLDWSEVGMRRWRCRAIERLKVLPNSIMRLD